MDKICVFCGKEPNKKNGEHVLPQWLIKLTGAPKRIVKFGTNYTNGKTIEFDWMNFTAPSCESCNCKYSQFEAEVKTIVDKVVAKNEITGKEIIKLLDWLDKVRIGLWLNYYYLEKNKANINPRLCIENRIGKKDRFLQIHFLESQTKSDGLNAFGVETFLFQYNPSSFALKINNILIINGSNDFIISENCGFPYPQKMKVFKNGQIELGVWNYNRETKTKICGIEFNKSVLSIFQVIQTEVPNISNFFNDSYLIQNCLDNKSKIGTIFKEENNILHPINDLDKQINYESVLGNDVNYVGDLISQVYDLQIRLTEKFEFEEFITFKKEIEFNNNYIDYFKNLKNNPN